MSAQNNSHHTVQSRNGDHGKWRAVDCDPLLPVQYYETVARGRTTTGEFKLFFAILEDALRCYVRSKACRSRARRTEFLDAKAWFHDFGPSYVFSFESTCTFLDIDPQWLRARLKSLTETDFPRKQFRTRRRHPGRPAVPATKCVDRRDAVDPALIGVRNGNDIDLRGCSEVGGCGTSPSSVDRVPGIDAGESARASLISVTF